MLPCNGSSHEGHAAHPAVVKHGHGRDGIGMIDLAALCHAAQSACDSLLDDFRQQRELAVAAAEPERGRSMSASRSTTASACTSDGWWPRKAWLREIRFTDVLKVVIVPTLDDGGRAIRN